MACRMVELCAGFIKKHIKCFALWQKSIKMRFLISESDKKASVNRDKMTGVILRGSGEEVEDARKNVIVILYKGEIK